MNFNSFCKILLASSKLSSVFHIMHFLDLFIYPFILLENLKLRVYYFHTQITFIQNCEIFENNSQENCYGYNLEKSLWGWEWRIRWCVRFNVGGNSWKLLLKHMFFKNFSCCIKIVHLQIRYTFLSTNDQFYPKQPQIRKYIFARYNGYFLLKLLS